MGGLLPDFSTNNTKGLSTINNGGEYHASAPGGGEKICKLFSFSDDAFRTFELFTYCNYTTVKVLCLMYGSGQSIKINVNILGKNGVQTFSIKELNGNIYLVANSITSVFEVRMKPTYGIKTQNIVMEYSNGVDLSGANQLASF